MIKFKHIILLTLLLLVGKESKQQSVLGTGANVDIILALQPINMHLQKLLMQQSKDYAMFEKMDSYQKKLDAVNDLKDVVINAKSLIEIATLIDNIVCISKDYFRNLDKYKESKLDFCTFNFKQLSAFSSLTMGLELYTTLMSSGKMSTSDRFKLMNKATQSLNTCKTILLELTNILRYA
ncbi:MAG: hypothetical protein JKY54_01645 [Flavobacteriales bacterium]|nr:hypothetical protein [Flavobacteriales bacterium]